MSIQKLSLFITDKVSKRNIFKKFLILKKYYEKDCNDRDQILSKKLSATLKNAYETIPYYYELAEKNNIRDTFLDFQIDKLKNIPTIDKKTLIDKKKFFLKPDVTEKLSYCFTNGSTGGRVSIAYNQEAIDWSSAVTIFCRYCYGHKLTNKEVHLATDTRSLDFKSQTSQFIKEFANNRVNIFVNDFNESSILKYLKFLKRQKTNLLHGMPSQISGLVNKNLKGFKIPLIETSGEILRETNRNNIEQFFSTKVIDRYGLAEAGVVAYQMPNNINLSVLDFHTFVEVDSDGEIIITTLNNEVMPLIRYRTGDYCEDKGIIEGMRHIKMKDGREHTLVKHNEDKLNTATLEDVIFQVGGVRDLQFQINAKKEIVKILVESENMDDLVVIKNKVKEFTNSDLDNLIYSGTKKDFKLSGTQYKQLRVALLD